MDHPPAAVRSLPGTAIASHLDDVARLRIAAFRDWPYLDAGNESYERDYLDAIAELDFDALDASRARAQVANDRDWPGQLKPGLVSARVEAL